MTDATLTLAIALALGLLLAVPGTFAQDDQMEKEGDNMEEGDDMMKNDTEEDPSIGVFAFLVAMVGGIAAVRRLSA